MPIEVFGTGAPDDPVVVDAHLALATPDATSVQSLYVLCHRCGFYNPPEFEALAKPLTKVKASLRIVGGAANDGAPWIDVTDGAVQFGDVERYHGGVNGGLVTAGFRVTIDEATRTRLVGAAGTNTIQFRFNGTDGNSNGYRILDLRFQDASGKNLSPVTKKWADIAAEKTAGKDLSDDASLGQALWTGRNLLVKSPIVPNKIRAACSDCHAADGRDLQYFNYSNNSIVQRSRFHGLSDAQGKQIAAYLRASLYSKVPHVAAAAPWNPPYQPGPGLDSKPIVEWAAGAGLDAVVPDGKAFMKSFVGKPVDDQPLSITQADLDAVMDPTKVLNTREIAVPLQFPDWNSWLPTVHPLDIWTPDAGQTAGLFETGKDGNDPLKAVADIEAWLDAHKNPNGVYGDWTHLTADQRDQLAGKFNDLGGRTLGFGGGGRGSRVSGDPTHPFAVEIGGKKMQALLSADTAALAPLDTCGPTGQCTSFSTESFIERADYGLYHWMGVKQWEIAHTWGLEGPQPLLHGGKDGNGTWVGQGEARGWPYGWPSVFYLAPHMIYAPEKTGAGLREFYFSWENRLVSYYRTNEWYQLQMTINPGWPGASNGAVDWPYHMGFTTGVVDDLITANAPGWISAAHLARYQEIRTKLAQLANTNIPFEAPDPQDPSNLFKDQGMQSLADLLFKLSPTALLDMGPAQNEQTRFRLLDEITPGLHLLFVNSDISLYDTLYANTDPKAYRRCDPNNMSLGLPEQKAGQRFCADATRTPIPLNNDGKPHLPGSVVDWTTEQYSVWGVMAATDLGADPARIKPWSDWNDLMWPQ